MIKPNPRTRGAAWITIIIVTGLLLLLAALLIPATHRTSCGPRSAASSNLRQIGMASLIYASEHHDRLPVVADLHAYMVALAQGGGLNDANMWIISTDPAIKSDTELTTVLNAEKTALNDDLKGTPIAWAVVLSGLSLNAGSHVPIAWTRGLQPDGTWSKDNPYKGEGGYIVFLGGNISAFTKDLKSSPLQRYDGQGTTTNIMEALPPGSRVGEWPPDTASHTAARD